MPHPKHEAVRRRYAFRCGYCGVSEAETGGDLTVDHFRPAVADGDDSDDNLVYACFRCNSYKGDFFPDGAQTTDGFRVLHPLLDRATDHFREETESGLLVALTETGRFHIALLRLNRPALVEHRRLRRISELAESRLATLEAEVESLREMVATQEDYVARLRRLLDL